MIAAMAPMAGVHKSLRHRSTANWRPCAKCCLLANLNAFAYDYCTRQKIGGVTLNFFIVEQVPTLPPDAYDKPCPWDRRTTLETWISQRVLKLTCTAEDMLPLADACNFTGGSFQAEYGGRLNKWDEAERAELMAELDAAFFHLYGIARDDVEYILSTFKGIHDQQPLFSGGSSVAAAHRAEVRRNVLPRVGPASKGRRVGRAKRAPPTAESAMIRVGLASLDPIRTKLRRQNRKGNANYHELTLK